MKANPQCIPCFLDQALEALELADAALAMMEKHSITVLPTVDADGRLAGVIHLHDILRSKLV